MRGVKVALGIVAIVISFLIWASYYWVIDRDLNIGIAAGAEFLIAVIIIFLILLAFPIILLWAVFKCSKMSKLGIIWGITIAVYAFLPLSGAYEYHERQEIFRLQMEMSDKIDSPATTWDEFYSLAKKLERKAAVSPTTTFGKLIDHERFDFALKMLDNGYDIRRFHFVDYLRDSYNASRNKDTLISRAAKIQFLLDNGCNINTSNYHTDNVLNIALTNHDNEAVQLLLSRGIDVFVQPGADSPLAIAAGEGDLDVVQQLLAKGIEVDVTDNSGRTPLFLAASHSKADVVKLLLAKGAQVNAADVLGETPLYNAVSENSCKDVALLLLQHGANAKQITKDGRSMIRAAVDRSGQDTKLLALLIQQGADVNCLDTYGYDPLYRAVIQGKSELAMLLIKAGAVLTRAYPGGETLIELADGELSPLPELKQFLIDHGAK